MQILDSVDAASLRDDIPDFAPGDTVKVHVNITEGSRSRIQIFQGVVIGRSGDDMGVLAIGQAWHRATEWPQRRPPLVPAPVSR